MKPESQSSEARALKVKKNGKARKPVWKILRIALLAILIVHLVFIGLTSALIFAYKFANPPTTVLIIYRSAVSHWEVQKPIPLKTEQIPQYIRRMLISVEDGGFYEHHGIDIEAIKRARELNEKVGKPMYGGSTITMQVARTLFLLPTKSYIRKYFEAITALELELILSKDRILELYFGYAEWGKGIFGIERASRVYFGKGVASINRDQAARLIALLSSPIKYTPDTLYRSAILRQRYAYLVARYVAAVPVAVVSAETPPPSGIEPSADISELSDEEEDSKTEQEGSPNDGELLEDTSSDLSPIDSSPIDSSPIDSDDGASGDTSSDLSPMDSVEPSPEIDNLQETKDKEKADEPSISGTPEF